MSATQVLELLDWRRRVATLYAHVRARRTADPEGARAQWARVRDDLFTAHPQSPLDPERRATWSGLPLFPYDPAWVLSAPLREAPPERIAIPGSNDSTVEFDRIGTVDLPFGRLDVFWLDAYGGGLFLPFRDGTAGAATYGSGRYLLDTVKGADLGSTSEGHLVLDFNYAYHPSCAWSPAWSCPLAPPGNRVEAAVPAGERVTATGTQR
jgi:uncharacterized protein (DUF1684 family)